jgi:hypothetical protein
MIDNAVSPDFPAYWLKSAKADVARAEEVLLALQKSLLPPGTDIRKIQAMTSINLNPTSVAVPPATDQTSASSLEQKVRDAVYTGLKMLSFAQEINKPDLSRLANSLSKQISKYVGNKRGRF